MFSLYVHVVPSGKTYFGITSQIPKTRWKNGRGYEYNIHFNNAIKKYGWKNIEHIVLISNSNKEQAKQLEIDFIKGFDSKNKELGYNLTDGGDTIVSLSGEKNGMFGKTHSPDARKRISNFAKERFSNIENHPMYGTKRSEKTKKKLSDFHKGRCVGENNYFWGKHFSGKDSPSYGVPKTKEAKLNMSNARKGRFMGADAYNARKIMNKTTGEVFDCGMDIKRKYGFDNSSIGKCCKGIIKMYKGFEWEYVN